MAALLPQHAWKISFFDWKIFSHQLSDDYLFCVITCYVKIRCSSEGSNKISFGGVKSIFSSML